jgi:chaperonin GroES
MSQQPQPLPEGFGAEPMETPQEEQPTPAASLRAILESANFAEKLDKGELEKIGADAKAGYESDKASRQDWEECLEEYTRLALQYREDKTFPWPGASNVKYPLLTTAAMQFAARAYPSLVPSDGKVVKSKVIGKDETGEKYKRADRISTYMSYQLIHEMKGWEEDMDKLLLQLPIVGCVFKKTFWDSVNKQPCSKLVLPQNLVVDYYATSLDTAERISELIELNERKVNERKRAGVFLDVDLGDVPTPSNIDGAAPPNDKTTPFLFIEQHTWLDLDDDGLEEPYVVTFHEASGKVVRIAARYSEKTITVGDDGELIKIEPIQYYTKFSFIPNPEGCFYDIGFGTLLGPINESVNTLINQLIDSGTLNNLQSGFLGKALKIRMGEQAFKPGEWKAVASTGDDLKKQIVPLPTKEPSNVLFQLMGSLITSGKELASVAEIFVGKMPGQNTPATTTMATIEQGMKVFTAVYKRIYRALGQEFDKLFDINATYLNPETYANVLDASISPNDFSREDYDVCPGADPTAVSQTEKLLKAQGLMELLPLGILDPVKVGLRILEAQEQPNYMELLNPQVAQTGQLPPPQPDPKILELQAKQQAQQADHGLKQQEMQFKAAMESQSLQFKQAMEKQAQDQELRFKAISAQLDVAKALHTTRAQIARDKMKFVQDTMHKEVDHTQKVRQTEEMGKVKQKQATKSPPKKRE